MFFAGAQGRYGKRDGLRHICGMDDFDVRIPREISLVERENGNLPVHIAWRPRSARHARLAGNAMLDDESLPRVVNLVVIGQNSKQLFERFEVRLPPAPCSYQGPFAS